MCESVYEKMHMQNGLTGTIKNDYLVYYGSAGLHQQLVTLTDKAVKMYNFSRPHSSLGKISPKAAYELSTKSAVVNKEKRSKKKKSYNNNKQ